MEKNAVRTGTFQQGHHFEVGGFLGGRQATKMKNPK